MTKLTALTVSKLKAPKTGRLERYDGQVPGFGVRVTHNGAKSWILVYVSPTQKTRRRFTIGSVADIALEDARHRALELRERIRHGQDPVEENQAATVKAAAEAKTTAGQTVRALIEVYYRRQLKQHRRGAEGRQILNRDLLPYWGDRPFTSITRVDVRERIEAVVDRGSPEAARRLFALIRALYNWAINRGDYDLDRSPCDRLRPSAMIGRLTPRDRILSDAELRAVWQAAQVTCYPYGPLVRLLALTGQRRSEVAEATWSEFDLDKALWVIPAARMKSNAAHVVPLSAPVLALLKTLPRSDDSDYLFRVSHADRPVSGFVCMKQRFDARIHQMIGRELPHWTLHDVRRTMRTGLSSLPVPDLVRELVIAHTKPGLHRVYDQHAYVDEKRLALELWAARLMTIVEPPPAGNVIPMSRSA